LLRVDSPDGLLGFWAEAVGHFHSGGCLHPSWELFGGFDWLGGGWASSPAEGGGCEGADGGVGR
jgi:hypothetical protein